MDINEVKERLMQIGYEVKGSDDTALLFCINRVEEHIRNICNTVYIPNELHYKSIDMVCGEFLNGKLSTGELEGYSAEDNRLIKTVSEGDTTVTYQDGGRDGYTSVSEYIEALKSGNEELYGYRRFKW